MPFWPAAASYFPFPNSQFPSNLIQSPISKIKSNPHGSIINSQTKQIHRITQSSLMAVVGGARSHRPCAKRDGHRNRATATFPFVAVAGHLPPENLGKGGEGRGEKGGKERGATTATLPLSLPAATDRALLPSVHIWKRDGRV
jgi:hypothetical protein